VASYLRSAIDASGGDDPDAEAFLAMSLLAPTRTKAEITEGFARSQRLLCDAGVHPI
jgi:hypothetical protein